MVKWNNARHSSILGRYLIQSHDCVASRFGARIAVATISVVFLLLATAVPARAASSPRMVSVPVGGEREAIAVIDSTNAELGGRDISPVALADEV
jgi:hypothetical protein